MTLQPSDLDAPGLGALLDFSFTRFITVSMVRFIYILGMLLIVLTWLIAIIAAFATSGFLAGLVAIVVVSIASLLNLLFLRMMLEVIVVLFRIGDNTSIIAHGGVPHAFPVMPISPTPPAP